MPCATSEDGILTVCRPPPSQRATRWTETVTSGNGTVKRFRFGFPPRRLLRCHKCGRWRQARSLLVRAQEWYDTVLYCADKCLPARLARRRAYRRRRIRLGLPVRCRARLSDGKETQ